jgi:hypothetical protein
VIVNSVTFSVQSGAWLSKSYRPGHRLGLKTLTASNQVRATWMRVIQSYVTYNTEWSSNIVYHPVTFEDTDPLRTKFVQVIPNECIKYEVMLYHPVTFRDHRQLRTKFVHAIVNSATFSTEWSSNKCIISTWPPDWRHSQLRTKFVQMITTWMRLIRRYVTYNTEWSSYIIYHPATDLLRTKFVQVIPKWMH